jgi:hypothetical protein
MALTLPEGTCAELALFLYDDPEMQHIARDIAAVCDPMLVIRKGGAKGIAVLATADELPVIRTNGHEGAQFGALPHRCLITFGPAPGVEPSCSAPRRSHNAELADRGSRITD